MRVRARMRACMRGLSVPAHARACVHLRALGCACVRACVRACMRVRAKGLGFGVWGLQGREGREGRQGREGREGLVGAMKAVRAMRAGLTTHVLGFRGPALWL